MLAVVIAVLIGAGLALYFKYLHDRGKKAEDEFRAKLSGTYHSYPKTRAKKSYFRNCKNPDQRGAVIDSNGRS